MCPRAPLAQLTLGQRRRWWAAQLGLAEVSQGAASSWVLEALCPCCQRGGLCASPLLPWIPPQVPLAQEAEAPRWALGAPGAVLRWE